MTIGRTRLGIGRQLLFCGLAGAFLVIGSLLDRVAHAEPSEPASIELIKTSLDEIEAAIERDDITQEALVGVRERLNSALDALRSKIDELEPQAHTRSRSGSSSSAPRRRRMRRPRARRSPKNAQSSRRASASSMALLKQARVLSVRIDQLSERVAQKRHALYASELFARTASALDPFFWLDAYRALPIELAAGERAVASLDADERSMEHASRRSALIVTGAIAAARSQ